MKKLFKNVVTKILIMAVQFLTQDNFSLKETRERGVKRLVCDMSGPVVVMFKSDRCNWCKKFMPYFTKIAQRDNRGVTYAILDVANNRKLVQNSLRTKTPIKTTPTFIVYNNKSPYARYKGKLEPNSFMSFLEKILSKFELDSNSDISGAFMNDNVQQTNVQFAGAPIEKERAQPQLPSGITKIPHNKPFLAFVKNGELS